MDRVAAAKLMAICQELAEQLNRATEVIGDIADEGEQRRLRRPVGEMMQAVAVELMAPIIREHPDFDPDKKSSQ